MGVSAFRKLIAQNRIETLLFTRSQVGMALNSISREKRIPILGSMGHPDFIVGNPYAFRIYPSVDQEAAALVAAMRSAGIARLAALSIEDEWNRSLAAAVERAFRSAGGAVIFSEFLPPNDSDPRLLLGRLRAANVDAIFLNFALGDSGVALRRIRVFGLRQPVFANFWAASPESLRAAGAEARAGCVSSPSTRTNRAFAPHC